MTSLAWDWNELSTQVILTFAHFLWQACVVAIGLIVVERLTSGMMRREGGAANLSAHVRYNLACLAFFSLPMCVVATFALVHDARGPFTIAPRDTIASAAMATSEPPRLGSRDGAAEAPPPPTDGQTPSIAQRPAALRAASAPLAERAATIDDTSASRGNLAVAPYFLIAYVLGVGLMLARFTLSIIGSSRLQRLVQPLTDSRILQLVAAETKRLRMRRIPVVAVCERVSSPMVVGILKPMILLPPAVLCGLEPSQLSAILAHELAHIRRLDLIVNLLQRIVESLLFFHPVTWWLSHRLSVERENCCDDVAAESLGRLPYAGALLQMAGLCIDRREERRAALAALAADGGNASDFGYRIRRLIDVRETTRVGVTRRSFAVGLTLCALLAVSWVAWAQAPPSKPKQSKPEQTTPDASTPQAAATKKAPDDSRPLDKETQWSTWGDNDGLLSGARLILPDEGLKVGEPLVVEYRLANISKEKKTFKYFPNKATYHWISLGRDNCLRGDLECSRELTTLTLEPGQTFIDSDHRVTIDTTGLEPGDYQVALGSAFHYPDETDSALTHEIPHRGRIPFQLAGKSTVTIRPAASGPIVWGKPIAGLQLGARLIGDPKNFAVGQLVEADLFISNATDRPLDCRLYLPHPDDGWLFNVENDKGDTILLQRPIRISIYYPQQFRDLRLAPGEVRALTRGQAQNNDKPMAGPRPKFEIADAKIDEDNWSDRTIKGRLVTQGGTYSAIFEAMVDRPEIPGVRLSLDTGSVEFTVTAPETVQPPFRLSPKVLDEATDRSILWGESVKGLRLGIRVSEFAKRRSPLRHGEHLDYQVWLKNESSETIRIPRDPRDLYGPRLLDDGSINVVGDGTVLSFDLPQDELLKAELKLPPGHAAYRFLEHSHSASIRPPGSPRGRFGPAPLLLAPGRYPVFAQLGELKSGVEEVEIVTAARLQVRIADEATQKRREEAAADPSDQLLSWTTSDGTKQEVIVNWDRGVLVDENDLASVKVVADDNQADQYSILLQLRPESTTWFARHTKMLSEWKEPPSLVILFDGKPLIAPRLRSSIPNGQLQITGRFTKPEAEAIAQKLRP